MENITKIRQETIYTFTDFDSAKEFAAKTPGGILSSPSYGVYEVVVSRLVEGIVQRYDLEFTGHAYSEYRNMEENNYGDWVRYDDVKAFLGTPDA